MSERLAAVLRLAGGYSSDARRAAQELGYVLAEAEHMDFADRYSALHLLGTITQAHEDLTNLLHDTARMLESTTSLLSEEQDAGGATQAPERGHDK